MNPLPPRTPGGVMTIRSVVSAGIQQEAKHRHHATLADFNGRHEWVVISMFRVANPAREQHLMDTENLLTIEGPGCLHCEQPWTPTLGSKCPGEPKPEDRP